MEIITIKDVNIGDTVIIENEKKQVIVAYVTGKGRNVNHQNDNGLMFKDIKEVFTFKPRQKILRIGTAQQKTNLHIRSENLMVTINQYWKKQFFNSLLG